MSNTNQYFSSNTNQYNNPNSNIYLSNNNNSKPYDYNSCRQPYVDFSTNEIVEPFKPSTEILIIALIAAIIVIGLFILIFFILRRGDIKDPPVIPIPDPVINPITSAPGSSTNGRAFENNGDFYTDQRACTNGPTRIWNTDQNINTGSCGCEVPFYGPKCFLESYDSRYIALGQIDPDDVLTNVLQQVPADRLSFSYYRPNDIITTYTEDICTSRCDANDDCIGVQWQSQGSPNFGINVDDPTRSTKGTCTLLKDCFAFKPGVQLSYNLDQQADYYLKNPNEPQVKDRVFVFNGQRPLRYWLTDSFANGITTMLALYQSIVYELTFRPTTLINSTGSGSGTEGCSTCTVGNTWQGLASDKPITGNLNDIYNMGNSANFVIIPPGTTNLNQILPCNWLPIYIVFWDPANDPIIS